MGAGERLFGGKPLGQLLVQRRDTMRAAILELDAEVVLKRDVAELAREMAAAHSTQPVTLGKVEVVGRSEHTQAGGLRRRFTKVVCAVAFEGDAALLLSRPSSIISTDFGTLCDGEIRIEVAGPVDDAAAVKRALDDKRKDLRQQVAWANEEAERFNASGEQMARQWIEQRRLAGVKEREMIEGVGLSVRPAPVAPAEQKMTTAARTEKKGRKQQASAKGVDVASADDEYERIIRVLLGAGKAMEKTGSFDKRSEGELRDQLLVALNTHYPEATAETHRFDGRTDILVQRGGNVLLVCECKVCGGSNDIKQAINQLFRYTNWRDANAAIALFTRDADPAKTLKRVVNVFEKHERIVRPEPYDAEGVLRFVLARDEDRERTLTVTVLVFCVPVRGKKATQEKKPAGQKKPARGEEPVPAEPFYD